MRLIDGSLGAGLIKIFQMSLKNCVKVNHFVLQEPLKIMLKKNLRKNTNHTYTALVQYHYAFPNINKCINIFFFNYTITTLFPVRSMDKILDQTMRNIWVYNPGLKYHISPRKRNIS